MEVTTRNPKGAGRKATGVNRVSICISGQPQQIEKLKELAKESGKNTSQFIFEKTGVIDMEKYVFCSLGKSGVPIAIIEAYSFSEAIEKFGEVDDKIPSFKRFSKHYTSGLYEVKKQGSSTSEYIIHSNRKFE